MTEKPTVDFINSRRSAGFPSPAADYLQLKLDLNQLLVQHREATFFMRVDGDAMIGDGIHSQDLLVVDRSLPLQHKKIAVIVLEGELLLKRVLLQNDKITLTSSNPEYEDIELSPEAQFEVWGIVTAVIHQF